MADDRQGGSVPVQSEEQFWRALGDIFSLECASSSHETIDDALRSWLYLVASCRDLYLKSEDDLASCSQQLVDSHVFCQNPEYVRTQIIYSLLQEDEAGPLHVIANFLLLDGRSDETSFRRMIDEGCFPRLVELINGTRDNDRRLHRLLLELMYEMSRIERVRTEDLLQVTDAFVTYMFQVIESLSDDADDPYHYPIIRVLLVLNEQYMVASTEVAVDPSSGDLPLTNRVIKVLSLHGPEFRTFGENIILLLNRETETSLQLLILKLLYLLFTTRATYEYFYTNDLRVLLDVIVRNLLDLPNESAALRHTYLRVLYPLLAHTQLSQPPHYKREEITRLLRILGGSGDTAAHFAPADETTLRLVERVAKVEWLGFRAASPAQGEVARKLLGISLDGPQAASCASVVDVAGVMEKPGVKTPSRSAGQQRSLQHEHDEQRGWDDGDAVMPKVHTNTSPEDSSQEQSKEPYPTTHHHQQPKAVKPKRVRPEVPKHRHGRLLAPPPSAAHVTGEAAAAVSGPGGMNLHVAAGGNGQQPPRKKTPPKAPPPRRGTRLRQAASAANLKGTTAESTPVS